MHYIRPQIVTTLNALSTIRGAKGPGPGEGGTMPHTDPPAYEADE
jgi:hypothetical protein